MKISFEEHFAWRWNFVRGKLCMAWKFCFKNTLDGTEDSGPEAWAGTFPQRRTWGDLVIFELLRSVLFLNALWLIELPSSYCHRINWNGKNVQNEFWVARLNKTCDCTTGRRNIPDAKHVHPLSSPFLSSIFFYFHFYIFWTRLLICDTHFWSLPMEDMNRPTTIHVRELLQIKIRGKKLYFLNITIK